MTPSHKTPEPQSPYTPSISAAQTPRRPPIPRLPHLSRTNGIHSRTASSDGHDKSATKRLVEQFYRGGVQSKQSSHTDVTDINALLSGSKLDLDAQVEKSNVFPSSGKTEVDQIYGAGSPMFKKPAMGAKFNLDGDLGSRDKLKMEYLSLSPPDLHAICPENILAPLLSVDRAFTSTNLASAVDAVDQSLQVLWTRVNHNFDKGEASLAPEAEDPRLQPGAQLKELEIYLKELRNNVNALETELKGVTVDIKSRYLEEIQENILKLRDLERLIESLSLRLSTARKGMAHSRRQLKDTVAPKMELLEEVSKRFHEYDVRNRQRKGLQIVIALSLFVLLVAMGAIMYRRYRSE